MTYNIKDIYNYNKTLREQTYVLNQFCWIDDKYKIDFEISKLLKNTIEEAKELDRNGNMEYFDVADTIDVICKNFVSSHTRKDIRLGDKEKIRYARIDICLYF